MHRLIFAAAALSQASCVPAPAFVQSKDPARPLEFCVVAGFPPTYSIRQIEGNKGSFLKIFAGKLVDQTVISRASIDDAQYCDVMVMIPQLMDNPVKVDLLSGYSKKFLLQTDSSSSQLYDRWATIVNAVFNAFRPGTGIYKDIMAERLKGLNG